MVERLAVRPERVMARRNVIGRVENGLFVKRLRHVPPRNVTRFLADVIQPSAPSSPPENNLADGQRPVQPGAYEIAGRNAAVLCPTPPWLSAREPSFTQEHRAVMRQ